MASHSCSTGYSKERVFCVQGAELQAAGPLSSYVTKAEISMSKPQLCLSVRQECGGE